MRQGHKEAERTERKKVTTELKARTTARAPGASASLASSQRCAPFAASAPRFSG